MKTVYDVSVRLHGGGFVPEGEVAYLHLFTAISAERLAAFLNSQDCIGKTYWIRTRNHSAETRT